MDDCPAFVVQPDNTDLDVEVEIEEQEFELAPEDVIRRPAATPGVLRERGK